MRSRHCTPAWVTRAKLRLKKKERKKERNKVYLGHNSDGWKVQDWACGEGLKLLPLMVEGEGELVWADVTQQKRGEKVPEAFHRQLSRELIE